MNFLYCALEIPGREKRQGEHWKLSLHVVSFSKNSIARGRPRLKNGKIDNVFILAESQNRKLEGYYPPFFPRLEFTVDLVFLPFLFRVDCRLQNIKAREK
jgi:hypothetical protein